jgi:hypothetical protein
MLVNALFKLFNVGEDGEGHEESLGVSNHFVAQNALTVTTIISQASKKYIKKLHPSNQLSL